MAFPLVCLRIMQMVGRQTVNVDFITYVCGTVAIAAFILYIIVMSVVPLWARDGKAKGTRFPFVALIVRGFFLCCSPRH